jgi:hypothetical protein
MFRFFLRRMVAFAAISLAASSVAFSQQPDSSEQQSGAFYWVNFHSSKDQSIVTWVVRSLTVEDWTAIREIGVMYDSALVVTTNRATPQSLPDTDSFNVWNVSLTNHMVTPVLKGVNLRWLAMLRLFASTPLEPAILYDNCQQCAANTYFTTFHYDVVTRRWEARWLNGGEGVAVWNMNHPAGMEWTQVYAVTTGGNGIAQLLTWNHFDFGPGKPPEDSVFRYDVDPFSGLDRTAIVSGKQVDATKVALCNAQDAVSGLARGQDSNLCREVLHKPMPFSKPLRGVPARRTAPPHTAAPSHDTTAPKR